MAGNINVCFLPECKSLEVAYPTFRFWAKGYPKISHDPVKVTWDVPCCPKHRQLAVDENKERVANLIDKGLIALGKQVVDRGNFSVEWNAKPQLEATNEH